MSVPQNTLDKIQAEITADLQQAKRKALGVLVLSLLPIAVFFAASTYVLGINFFNPQTPVLNIVVPSLFVCFFIFIGWSHSCRHSGVPHYEWQLKSVSSPPLDEEDYNLRADTFEERGYLDEALADYKQAYQLDPQENVPILFPIIDILWETKHDGAAAMPFIEELLTADDEEFRAEGYCFQGKVLAESDEEAAAAAFDKAVETAPDSIDLQLSRLQFLATHNRHRQALNSLDEVQRKVRDADDKKLLAEIKELLGV